MTEDHFSEELVEAVADKVKKALENNFAKRLSENGNNDDLVIENESLKKENEELRKRLFLFEKRDEFQIECVRKISNIAVQCESMESVEDSPSSGKKTVTLRVHKPKCKNCGEAGHYSNTCNPKNDKKKSNNEKNQFIKRRKVDSGETTDSDNSHRENESFREDSDEF